MAPATTPSTNNTVASTALFAASIRCRTGTHCSVARMLPVAYSAATNRLASAITPNCAEKNVPVATRADADVELCGW